MHPLPNSKSSSSTATERKNNTRSTWPRWIRTGLRFLSNCKAPPRSSKTLHKLPTSPASPSSTRASPPMSAKSKISNQSSFATRAASRQSEKSWTVLPIEADYINKDSVRNKVFHSLKLEIVDCLPLFTARHLEKNRS